MERQREDGVTIMTNTTAKETGIRIGVNQLVTYLTLIPIFWFVLQPLILNSMAEDIKAIVAQEAEPINNAFVALLQRDINATRKEIAALEFRERTDDEWVEEDALYLADLEIELAALEEAKSFLQADNTS
jgi:hypothetical protein